MEIDGQILPVIEEGLLPLKYSWSPPETLSPLRASGMAPIHPAWRECSRSPLNHESEAAGATLIQCLGASLNGSGEEKAEPFASLSSSALSLE